MFRKIVRVIVVVCVFASSVIHVHVHASDSTGEDYSYQKDIVDKLVQMEMEFQQLKQDVRGLKLGQTPLIGFSAYNIIDYRPGSGQIMVFRKVLLNAGNGYNPITGVFNVPVKGMYQFTAHTCNAPQQDVAFSIFLDEVELAATTIYERHSSVCGSVTALTLAYVGQKVTVRSSWYLNEMFENDQRRASFIGFLVHSKIMS